MAQKRQSGMSLSDEGYQLLDALQKKLRVSRNAVLELAVSCLSEREGVTASDGTAAPTREKPGSEK